MLHAWRKSNSFFFVPKWVVTKHTLYSYTSAHTNSWAPLSLIVAFTSLSHSLPLFSFHSIIYIFSSFGFNVCTSSPCPPLSLSLSPPPPPGWCQCCCQAGAESSQSGGSVLRSSGVMLGSFMLIRWALPNVGHASPLSLSRSLSLSLTLRDTHTHT